MDKSGLTKEKVLTELNSAYHRDHHFKDGRILASMCTMPHEIAIEAHNKFIETNLGNPGLYPGSMELEDKVIGILGKLLNGDDVYGHMTSGGTESNITTLWIAKKLSRKTEVLIPKNSHFSVFKAIDLLNLRPVEIELDSSYTMSLSDVESKLSEETAAVVCMAGTTELGGIDPIKEISEF